MKQAVLFVCTGNICRSPAAEVLLKGLVGEEMNVASAGTSDWHVGDGPTNTNLAAAKRAGFDLDAHRAQQFGAHHFDEFTCLIGMTQKHCDYMENLRPPGDSTPVRLFSSFDTAHLPADFPDPYGQDDRTYDRMWMALQASMPALATELGRG